MHIFQTKAQTRTQVNNGTRDLFSDNCSLLCCLLLQLLHLMLDDLVPLQRRKKYTICYPGMSFYQLLLIERRETLTILLAFIAL